ncbi:OsmC family peroxiredoxin [Arthrobacter glacialis]|uniref:Peroxiredoxin n=1 Tax=Arthrobacter glacialis TaxID=1664 RepID=A0A2S3ZVN1_ARTGL|nr:OsmC family peroxiredoxin [Arthrobacter glacialis]POH57417.1 peroxiredoxin [Arthrobacter glacialis]POH73260.1 peroxiredoxin [Arthrobacter glacialis]
MASTRNAHTGWVGNLATGTGHVTLDSSELGTYEVTWKARTEASEGKTSPEELIAAAHSSCFAMGFTHALDGEGYTAEYVNTSAAVTFVPGTGITGSHLTLATKIPGISQEDFDRIANDAKLGCPVSGALAAINITLEATLEA